MKDHPETELLQQLTKCPLFSTFVGPSLQQRVSMPHWFENRFIQAMFRNTAWIEKHERLLEEADIGRVKNSDCIFDDLDGGDSYYDLKIFDVLAEVRLIVWARENGYTDVEKLIPGREPTPDFLIKQGEEVTIAEAKRYRERDFLPEFVEDRLKGLVLRTGCLAEFGLEVSSTDKYDYERDELLGTRRGNEHRYRAAIREELTEEWMKALDGKLGDAPQGRQEIVNGLFVVRRSGIPHDVCLWLSGPPGAQGAEELMLEKLSANVMQALKQIRYAIRGSVCSGVASRALVFLSGTSSFSYEWHRMWKALCENGDSNICERASEIHREASEFIELPFELIVARHEKGLTGPAGETTMTLEYVPFPWPTR